MKIKKTYVLRKIADNWVVLPLAEKNVNFSGMITLNESGAMLWKSLEGGSDKEALVQTLLDTYDVSEEQARVDVEEFLEKLTQAGCMQ